MPQDQETMYVTPKQVLLLHQAGRLGPDGPKIDVLPDEEQALVGADLSSGIYLAGARINGVDLNSAHLPYAYLEGSDLSRSNFSFADLRNAKLATANLHNTDFYETELMRADLRETSCRLQGLQVPCFMGRN